MSNTFKTVLYVTGCVFLIGLFIWFTAFGDEGGKTQNSKEDLEITINKLESDIRLLESENDDLHDELNALELENENLNEEIQASEERFEILLGCYENDASYCSW